MAQCYTISNKADKVLNILKWYSYHSNWLKMLNSICVDVGGFCGFFGNFLVPLFFSVFLLMINLFTLNRSLNRL